MTAYLQSRGASFAFRIAVPTDLREVVGKREIVHALPFDRHEAGAQALELAARAKRHFRELRQTMKFEDKLKATQELARLKIKIDDMREQHYDALLDAHSQRINALREQGAQHDRELLKAQTEANTLKSVIGAVSAPAPVAPAPAPVSTPSPAPALKPAPKLAQVVNGFLDRYRNDKSPAMFKKHRPVLTMFVEVIGDKPIDELKQADINDFFDVVCKLPPRWRDTCDREKISIRALAERSHPETLGPKSFEDTYLASVRPFMKAARINWSDQGWPIALTTEGIEYSGDREGGEEKQRALKPAEIERLFHGPELQAAIKDPRREHEFWLPAVGFYTGARVNEVCQINPQTDILKEPETGIDYFLITAEGETGPGARKSVKTDVARKVPIHSRLIELGFLDYVERVRKQGAKMLFPAWKPSRGRASGEAEKWFRRLFERLELRDDTPGAKLVGFHAWRHTLLTTANNARPRIDATPISGHVGKEDAVVRGYSGELSLTNKRDILEAIPFKIELKASGAE